MGNDTAPPATNEPVVNDIEVQKLLFQTQVSEAAGLYDLLIKLAGAVFGGVLLFLEKFLPKQPAVWLLFGISIALGLLVTSIALTVTVRRKNVESLNQALLGNKEAAEQIEKPNERRTTWAVWTLIAGMFLILVFGVITFAQHTCEVAEANMRKNPSVPVRTTDSVTPSTLLQQGKVKAQATQQPPVATLPSSNVKSTRKAKSSGSKSMLP